MASEVKFKDVRRMIEDKGYTLARISGSHRVFTKDGARSVPIPVHKGKVKHVYMQMVKKLEK